MKLNLLPGEFDSDGDGIPDQAEVEPFLFQSLDWYTNPMSKDTDRDGLLDGIECPERVPPSPTPATWGGWIPGVCHDTDGDGTPDVFDRDDDQDGVPSIVDASPTAYDTEIYSQNNPFKLSVTNLAPELVFINYQLMPTNPDHLTFALNVLDWPTGDVDGQINRVSETTFATGMDAAERAQDPKADNGDLRLLPMIEVVLTGTTLPLEVTNQMTIPISLTVGLGEINLTGQAGNTLVSLNTGPAGNFNFYHAVGTCGDFSALTAIGNLSTVSPAISVNIPLGDIADGNRAFLVMDASGENILNCANVYPVAHGAMTDQVVDGDFLTPYGASTRDDGNGNVVVYAPLSLVYDYAGSTPTAFQAKLPFTNQTGGSMILSKKSESSGLFR